MGQKIIRDPLYNYISIDSERDGWLLKLLDCPELQRLRRIHQLGVSDITYPGASHTRFAHTLGVLHLMQKMHGRIEEICSDESVKMSRARLLAAALLHDVGHGPFSHLFEPCLGIDHEVWSVRVVQDADGSVNRVLRDFDPTLPDAVAQLIEKDNYELPQWQKFLLSSQLDADRMDYLRRDSLFSGGGYGHFDWYRLINTLEIHEDVNGQKDIVWPEKAKFAIEEYIFARYYMYQNVYLHKTTRGMEQLLIAMWKRAKALREDGSDTDLVPALKTFWGESRPSVAQYLAIEEFTVLEQIQRWTGHSDDALRDLALRFLNRDRFAMIESPGDPEDLSSGDVAWHDALRELVRNAGYSPAESYCLQDRLKGKYHQPYFPERESDEQSAKNAIRLTIGGESRPIEISEVLPRLKPITRESRDRYRYYVPRELRERACELRSRWSDRPATG